MAIGGVILAFLIGCSENASFGSQTVTAEGELENADELSGAIDQSELAPIEDFDPSSPEYFEYVIKDLVYFDVDQSAITDEASAVLEQQARWLVENPDFDALVEGHADEQGTREYNLALGARRAAAVRRFLVAHGVSESRISTISYGKERPVAACSNESCWSLNRRGKTAIAKKVEGFG